MKILRKTTFVGVAILTVLLLSFSKGPENEKSAEGKIKWLSMEEALKKNQEKPKKIFIDVYTSWCGWCKVMDKQTFSDPQIADYVNKYYYPVKFNAEMKDTLTFKNKEYVFIDSGRRGYHELAAELMNRRMSYPTIVFLDEKVNLIQAIPGFRKPPELDMILKYFGDNHYRQTDYETFSNSYVSPYSEEK